MLLIINMVKLNEPVDILVEFLRAEYKEPARSSYSKRHTNTTETFSGDDLETEFVVSSPKLLCVNSVSVGGTDKAKYVEYDIDLRNNKIVFKTAPITGSNNISVDYDYNNIGQSWIYPRDPEREQKLTKADYPRVAVSNINSSGDIIGIGDDTTLDSFSFQIDIVTKKGVVCTDYKYVNGSGTVSTISETNLNKNLVVVLKRGLRSAVKRNLRSKMRGVFFYDDQLILEDQVLDFESELGVFRSILTLGIAGFNTGEII
jgi:hypothetical protein